MRLLRFRIGRALIHLGLRVLPAGGVRTEITGVLEQWAQKVYKELAER